MKTKNIKTVNLLWLPFYIFLASFEKDPKGCLFEFCNCLEGCDFTNHNFSPVIALPNSYLYLSPDF